MKLKLMLLVLAALLLAACQPIQPITPESATVPPAADAQTEAESAAPSFAGTWNGDLEIAGIFLRVVVHLEEGDAGWTGTIDIPQQNALGIPLHDIVVEPPSLAFQMLEGQALGVFAGELDDDGVIRGEFTQGGLSGTLDLSRAVAVEPVDLPYVEEEVTFDSPGATLAGTLTLPEGAGPFPALVLVTGSGAQNRNEEIAIVPGYRPFHDIADRLTQSGFAVLRYDDRGVGDSTGDFATATIDDFAADATAAIDYLRSRPEIDPDQVGIMGHSEGAHVAALVGASDPNLPYVIAWAGAAVPGSEIIRLQAVLQAAASGMSGDELEALRTLQNNAVDFMLAEDLQGFEDEFRAYLSQQYDQLTPEEQASVGDKDAVIDQQIELQLSAIQHPWFQTFLRYDPADDWSQVTAPVLAFFGELDTQVDPEQNRAPLEAALAANPDATVITLPGANHLFQRAVTGGATEYASLDPTLIPEFLDILTAWLVDHAKFVQ